MFRPPTPFSAPHRPALWALILPALAACVRPGAPPPLHPPEPRPVRPVVDEEPVSADAEEQAWWTRYDDATLDALIAASRSYGTDLQAGWARIREADAVVLQALGRRLPTMSATAGVGYSQNVTAFGNTESTTVDATLPLAYELNLAGRDRRNHQAAIIDADVARLDQENLRLTSSFRVAEAWYAYVEASRRLALQDQLRQSHEATLQSIQQRIDAGLASRTEAMRQQLLLEDARLLHRLAESDRGLRRQELEKLLGGATVQLPDVAEWPSLPPLTIADNAEAVAQRPDVRAAQRRVEAADHRVAGAIAARYPSLRLNLTPGVTWQRNSIDGNFGGGTGGSSDPTTASGFTLITNAGLNIPLFDGFAGRAQVQIHQARVEGAVVALEELLRNSLVEVALAQLQEQRAEVEAERRQAQAELSQAVLAQVRERYEGGLQNLEGLLTAQRDAAQSELRVLAAIHQQLRHRIALHRALGGN